jgi:hypothetical protein
MTKSKIQWLTNPKNVRNSTSTDGRWSINCLYAGRYELYDVRERTVIDYYETEIMAKWAAEENV